MSKKKNPIKCTFFGFTMAETKRNKIIRFLKKNNYDFEETYDYKIIVRNITFEGFHCQKVKLDFFVRPFGALMLIWVFLKTKIFSKAHMTS